MPNPYFNVQIISRSAGQSAVASASYRSGEVLHDQRIDQTFDYSRKQDVCHSEIRAPDAVPQWATQRDALWNQVEATEKRKDAQLARDVIAALPRELNREQQVALVRAFVDEQCVVRGMVADVAIHEAQASDGGTNPHAHIMLTLRDLDANGFGKKNRDWNKRELVTTLRDAWEAHTNRFLEEAGSDMRLSLQSYKAQGMNKQPEEHMGHGAWNLERKGVETEKGNRNRTVRQYNAVRQAVRQQVDEPERLPHHQEAGERDGQPERLQTTAASSDSATQQQALRHYVRHAVQRTVRASAEWINRVGEYVREWIGNAKETRGEPAPRDSVFDRFGPQRWTERERQRQWEKDTRGYER